MQRITPMIDDSGAVYNVGDADRPRFDELMKGRAQQRHTFRGKDGQTYNVPEADRERFQSLVPDAEEIHRFQMDDGESVSISDSGARALRDASFEGGSISRKAWKDAGLPEKYGRSAKERAAFAQFLGESGFQGVREQEQRAKFEKSIRDFTQNPVFPQIPSPEHPGPTDFEGAMKRFNEINALREKPIVPGDPNAPDLGVFEREYLNAVASSGNENAGWASITGRMLPVIGSFIRADDARVNDVYRRIMNGGFKDTFSMRKAVRTIGIPDEIIEEVERNARVGKTAMGFPVLDDKKVEEGLKSVIEPLYKAREATKQRAQTTLSEAAPPSAMTEVLSGALHLPAGVAELTPLGFALSAFPNAIAKAEDHIAKGDSEGEALTKAFASEGVDYLVWNKLGKLVEMIPGAKNVVKGTAQKLARNSVTGSVVGQNALQLLEMNAKSGLIDLANNVVGLYKASSEEKADFGEWVEDFLSVPGNAKKMLMMLPAHLMMKGSAKVKQFSTAEGRKIAADVKSQRKFVEDFIGKDEARGLSDRDVGNLYRLVSSENFSEESVRNFISGIEGDAGQANLRAAARTAGDVRQGLEDIESLSVPKGESEAYKAMARKADMDAQNAEHATREQEVGDAFVNNQLTREGNERIRAEKRQRKADEAAERERAEREAREAAEEQERAIQQRAEEEARPRIQVEKPEAEAAPADRKTEYPEYAEWLRKNGKADIDKNWNKFVAQNEMDPALKVVRDKKGNPVKPEAKEPEVSEQKPVEKPQGQEGKTQGQEGKTPEPPTPAKPEADGETASQESVGDNGSSNGTIFDIALKSANESEDVKGEQGDKERTRLVQNGAAETVVDYVGGNVNSEAAFKESLDAFRKIVGMGELERDSAGVVVSSGIRRLAHDLRLSRFATDEQKAELAKYDEPDSAEATAAPAAEPAKTAPASAPREEGTTTPPKGADAPRAGKPAAGGVVKPKPDGKGKMVKPAPTAQPKSTAPVVDETGKTAEVVPPDSVEAKISAMKRGSPEQLKAQREYLEQEIAKARAAIDGKFEKLDNYGGRGRVKWLPKDEADDLPPTVTVKVPGDGEFTVKNTPEGMDFLDKIAAKFKPQKSGKAAEVSAPSVPRPPTVTVAKKPKEEPAHKEMEPFVSTDRTRASLMKPMSDGEYVYATNGKVAIRRPLRKGEKVKGADEAPIENVRSFFDNKDPDHKFKANVSELYSKLVQADAVTGDGDDKGWVELWHDGSGKLHIRARDGAGNSYATDAGSDYVSKPLTVVNGQYLRDFLRLAAKHGAGEVEIGVIKKAIGTENSADFVTLKGGEIDGLLVSITNADGVFKNRAENDARLETARMMSYGEKAWVASLSKKLKEERDGLVATATQGGTTIDNELKAKIAKAKDDLAAFDAKHGKPEFVSEFVKNGGKAPAKPKKGKGGADGKLGSPDTPSPLRPVKNGEKAEHGELDLATGEQGGSRRAKLSPDMSKPENARSFRTWLKEVPAPPTPEWLDDGSPKAVFDWFEKNMVGRTFAFDIPGYGHREFTVAPGHIGKLVCGGAGKGIITKPLSKGWMEAVRNGEVDAKDVNGWDAKRARMLPRVPVLLDSFDAVIHEFDTKHNADVFTFIKRFNTKNGRPNTIVMKLVDDGKTIGPVSTHVKDITVSWLKNKDLILTEGGEVYGRSADNSASRKPPAGDNAEGNSPAGADSVPPTGVPVNGENLKISDGQTIDRTGTPTKENPLGQIVAPKEGSVAQAIDAEIAADEALAAKGKGKPQGVPPAPAPGSAGNVRLDPGYEPESIGAGVKNPVARQQIVDKFKELFGDTVAIRGKNTTPIGKSFSGHYEPNAGVIRSKDPVSLRTIPHEIGHHIDALLKRQGLARPANVRSELIALGRKLYGPKKPKGGYEAEGYAELIKYYLQGNDAGLKKETPAAYDWLTNKFGKANPDTMARLDAMRDMIDRLQNQSGEEAVRAIRAKNPSLAERVVNGIGRMVQAVKPTQENWLDMGAFITKGMRASGLHGLFDWQGALKRGDVAAMNDIIENHPVLKWKLYNGKAGARAYRALEKGLTDLSGTRRYTYGDLGIATPGHAANEALPTFREIFGDFTAREMDAFQDYAIARIAKEAYLDKGLEFGLTAKEVEPVIRKYANNAKFRDALERYTHYKHGVLHLLVDAGAMSQAQFEAIVAANPIYVKIARRRESTDFFKDKMLKRQGKAVNRRTGSGRQVEDIFDAGLIDDERVFAAAFQADLLRSLVNAGKRGERAGGVEAGFTTGANWLREVPNAQGEVKFTAEKLRKQITDAMQNAGQATDKATANTLFDALFDDGKDTLSVFKEKPSNGKNGLVSLYDQEGKLHTYELPENNAEGWAKGLMGFTDATKPNLLEQWAQIAAAATRSGATTLNPVFALRNIVKDTLHAATVNEFGAYIPGASTVQGIAMDMMDTNAAEIFKNMGIPMGSMLGESRLQSAHKANKYLMSKNWFVAQWNKGVKKAIADFVGFSENGSRIKEFKLARDYMLKHGASEKAADMIAGCNALDITIDFQRGGEASKAINRFIPFFNAGIQGIEQAARSLGLLRAKEWQLEQNRGKRAARTVLHGAAWLTSLALAAELYNRSDDERKKKADELKPHEKWNYISFGDVRLPVPYEIGYVFASIPRAVAAEMYDGQEGAVGECLNMLRKTMPGLSPRDMALIGPALNVAMNESWTGSAIVPDHVMRGKRSYDWYDDRTTEFSKRLARAFHGIFGDSKVASPAHLDAFLNGVTGNMYGRILGTIEGESTFDEKRPHTWPVIGTFFRNNATASRVVSDFYERKEDLTRMKGSKEASGAELTELKSANKVAETLSSLRKAAETIRADTTLSTTERNDRLERISLKTQEICRNWSAWWREHRSAK